jgi:hypothetical protein
MCIKHGVLEIDNMHTRDIGNHAILFRAYIFGMAVVCDRVPVSGADPGFQVRGGALKIIAPSGGRR